MKPINWSTPLSYEKQEVLAPGTPNPVIEVEVGRAEVQEVELIRWQKGVERDVEKLRARAFVKLVEEGASPNKAAETLQTDIRTIKRTRGDVEASVQAVLDSHGWMVPDLRKAYVRARQLEILDIAMEGVAADPTDSKLLKVALDATAKIGDDVEVGLYEKRVVPPAPQQLSLPPGLAALVDAVALNPAHERSDEPRD